MTETITEIEVHELLRLDLGAGKNPRVGFKSVDVIPFDGVDIVADLKQVWPWADGSVEELNASHFLEHFDGTERIHILNEAYRVLKPGGKFTFVVPYWGSCRAYGDPTHKWPPVSEFSFYYWNKTWRDTQAPHTDAEHWEGGFKCDFDFTYGYNLRADLQVKNDEFKQFAVANYKDAVEDIIGTLTKR